MVQESPAKIKLKKINQICILVNDLEVVADNFWKVLGIGPWAIFKWEAPMVYGRTYHGKTAWAREKIALTQVGDLQLELAQAIDGPSLYRDWVEEHGEGFHHINFLLDTAEEYKRTVGSLNNDGFEILQSGRFGPPEKGYRYTYIDIPPLRTIWEPVYESKEDAGLVPLMFPDTKEESPGKIKVKNINRISIAVKNAELVAENFWKILGIGPWSLYNWEVPLVYDRRYHGKPAWAREKRAIARLGGMQLELMQAIDGPSLYGDWVEKHGEGLHHVNFLLDTAEEYETTVKSLINDGFESLQSGRFGPPEKGYGYTSIDIPPLRSIWGPVYEGEVDIETIMVPKE
jgi:hypothetical protein